MVPRLREDRLDAAEDQLGVGLADGKSEHGPCIGRNWPAIQKVGDAQPANLLAQEETIMKWLPGSLFFVGAFGFFIAAAFADAAGAFIVMGCAFSVLGIAMLRLAQTAPESPKP